MKKMYSITDIDWYLGMDKLNLIQILSSGNIVFNIWNI